MATARRPSASASSSDRLAVSCSSTGTSARSGPPVDPETSFQVFRAIFRFRRDWWPVRSVGLKIQNSSGSSCPCTTASPSPKAPLMSTTSRNPLSGSSVNMTPEEARSETTIFCTATDSRTLR